MKLYNTLKRKIVNFEPINGNKVKMYSCGPTVYDYYHIGNLRNAVFNDTLRRILEMNDYNVSHVMNITDVGHLVSDADDGEDKLEKGAKREGKTVWQVAEHYTNAFKNDMKALNILPPNAYKNSKYDDNYARATDFITEQIEMIEIFLNKKFAYITKHAIYFDVTKLHDYGILSGQKLADKEIGARSDVVLDTEKKNPHDFAVWFFATEHFANHTMKWDSPWGSGFPGWHLECSAIIHATLGDPIDIHTGGIDHIGTHHTNEIAQTQAAYENSLANYWVHNEFILVDNEKMSKSKNNSFTLKDVTEKGYDSLALRLLYLQAHYRTELNFSWDNLEAAQNRLKKYRAIADLRWQVKDDIKQSVNYKVHTKNLLDELANDMNTPKALAIINNAFDDSEQLVTNETAKEFNEFLSVIDTTLGLGLLLTSDISEEQQQLISKRATARETSDWEETDRLRDILKEQGIGIRDSEHGQIWYRI